MYHNPIIKLPHADCHAGYTVQSPGSSSGDSSFALTPDSPPDSPLYEEDDPFASPTPLSTPTSWDQLTEVLESPEGYI